MKVTMILASLFSVLSLATALPECVGSGAISGFAYPGSERSDEVCECPSGTIEGAVYSKDIIIAYCK
ncbi:hypothetical protein RU639_001827 [Aspergillus parasiticus]